MQQHLRIESPEELRDRIQSFWYTCIEFGEGPAGFEILPDGYVELVFLFGSQCHISTTNGIQALPSPFLMGLQEQPAILHSENRLEVIGVKCFPWTVFDLLGLPSGNDAVRIFQHPIAQLQPALEKQIQAGRTEEALAQVQRYFVEARRAVATGSLLYKAGIAMRKANGSLHVNQVAAAAHATVRTLQRNFKQSSGYTVKDVSALMRFEQVRNRLWIQPDTNLAALSHELGYTDQAHLSREFKRYSGTSPAAFARQAKKGKRVVSNDFVAFVQA